MKIEKRIDLLKKEIQKPSFLKGQRMGGEIPFHIFDYPPAKEQLIRESIPRIILGLEKNQIIINNINLYEVCLEIITNKTDLQTIINYERKKGSDKLIEKIRMILNNKVVNNNITKKIDKKANIIFVTGIGNCWPFLRAHTLLNNLQSVVAVPLVLFYPGKFSQQDLSLFGLLKPTNYYRANRLIDDKGGYA